MSCASCQQKANYTASYLNPVTIGKGIVGQFQSKFHINRAPEDIIKARRDICRECPEATKSDNPKFAATKGLTNLSKCKSCLCPIYDKSNVLTEQCPLGKWDAQN